MAYDPNTPQSPREPEGYPPGYPHQYQPQQPLPPTPGQPGYQEWRLARKRLEARRGLSGHAVAYVVVNLFLIAVWALSGGGYFWPAWVLAGWGVGLVLNAWEVLWRRPITEADIEREIHRGRPGGPPPSP